MLFANSETDGDCERDREQVYVCVSHRGNECVCVCVCLVRWSYPAWSLGKLKAVLSGIRE